ncbi:hypothetical protein ASPWEDRAFT_179685 [Aspergillus wentii DTO 134E9]|uniref:AAA+ ATPase domain-containing protein n=1 Tax=Aspergillus wentii DTO 134E9 TaxID=1073089 RepID=A0A1L9RSZ8_ASPWE|nr:uncharacterized protein ASPWEDRAFT_179685 [Aspergillus wentii DTO 134E9]OJJ38081.1 hypothetical protein ASPWEDRAFT_179685 [Aspergillus wentii DTO 134E9]
MGEVSAVNMPTTDYDVPGSICEAHHLYQSKPDERGRTSWTSDIPGNLVKPAENSESSKYALIIRNIKCYDGRKNLTIHSIVVQSDRLKKFLATAMAGYPGLTLALDRIEFARPFKPFVHRWEQFSRAREEEVDAITKTHVDLLYHTLESELGDMISQKNDLVKNSVITHDLLWTIFEPGDHVFSIIDGRQHAFNFEAGDVNCRTGNFDIASKYIDFDGEKFGHQTHAFKVPFYEGTLPIMELPVFPLAYHSEKTTIREDLIARGRLWEEHKGYHYKQYEGIAKGYFLGRPMKFSIKSRIVIDTEAYNTFNADEAVSVSGHISGNLSDAHRLIATPTLRGYALKDKKWLEFDLDGVKDIVWDSRAFDSLVLPNTQQDLKKLILAFAQSQSRRQDAFDDVIQGKGRGVIMLLRGPPGVGKTLTAESVAEVMKVPLYVLSAGDLGTNSSRVEDSLKDILCMVPRWGAVLLLDEADVFMEARDKTDLERNELVSIFLRLLEYYEGILFLTTNRAENIDPAFESRIHVSIRYPDLNTTSRRQIWTQFLSETKMGQLSEEKLDEVCKLELNGRQIKNVLRTAHLLAQEDGCGLDYSHVQTVLTLRASE